MRIITIVFNVAAVVNVTDTVIITMLLTLQISTITIILLFVALLS